jgi:hypothetical protein
MLKLFHYELLEPEVLLSLYQVAKSGNCLHQLKLSLSQHSLEPGMNDLLECLSHPLFHLTSLSIYVSDEPFLPKTQELFNNALQLNISLKNLSLRMDNRSNAQSLAFGIGKSKSIICLDLGCNDLDDDFITAFCLQWASDSPLQHLNLFLNKIGPNGAEKLMEALKQHSGMVSLNLHQRLWNIKFDIKIKHFGIRF